MPKPKVAANTAGQDNKRTKIEEAIEKSAKSAREGRLIVRNVGFNVNVDQLRERFQDYGEIVDVVLPPSKRISPTTADGKRMRIPPHAGYGFVEFYTREEAQQAITAVNGSRIGGRPVAVDFSYDIRIYQQIKSKESAKPAIKEETVAPVPEEPVPEPKRQKKVVEPVVEVKIEQKEVEKEKEDSEKRKLFMINVPFDATRADVETGLCEFGGIESSDIESVLFVKDKETSKPTGRCFVVFKASEISEKIHYLEESSKPQLFGDLYKNQAGKPAVAPLEGAGCVILGRRVSIMKPLSKKEIEERKRAKEEEEQPKNPKVVNRKNIDYINAGWINETHEEIWASIPPRDQKLRNASNEEKKFKIKNPNYVINTNRLMVRNVPKKMENGDLLTAALKAMKITGPKKVKQAGIIKVAIVKDKVMVAVGDRKPKEEEEFDMNAPESDDEDGKTPTTNQDTKLEMKEKKKSRGFAFIDFTNSDSALKCLEAMNNVPGAFGEAFGNRRPIVEFSFDDVRKLQIQKQRELKKSRVTDTIKPQVKKVIDKKLSRGQRQRAQRRALREKQQVSK
jgi:RNA recognition motif-containing protein